MDYELGVIYRDKANPSEPEDKFMRWINIEGSGMANSPGIRPLKFLNSPPECELPAFLVLVTHEKSSGLLNPWDDVVDLSSAEILYWGDAKKHETKRLDDFRGNSVLRKIYDYILEGKAEFVPPILHFTKPKSGYVKFSGLCVLDKLEISWFDDGGQPVRNYHAKLTVLDCEKVSIAWLHARVRSVAAETLDRHDDCPKAWLDYKNGHKRPIDIWAQKIRTGAEQIPAEGTADANVLLQLLDLEPYEFELVVVELFRELTDITHHIKGTKPTGDGGFDFFGSFVLPRPIKYEIRFRGEVKRYARSTSVDPKSVSRLVARLGRQEFGIFVTTSYFTKQAQREVLADAYPVHLISGADLVYMFKHLRLVAKGKIKKSWIDAVLNRS